MIDFLIFKSINLCYHLYEGVISRLRIFKACFKGLFMLWMLMISRVIGKYTRNFI